MSHSFSEVLAGIPRASYNTFKKTSRDPRRFWEQLQQQYLSKNPVQINHLLEKIENLRISMNQDGIRTDSSFQTSHNSDECESRLFFSFRASFSVFFRNFVQ